MLKAQGAESICLHMNESDSYGPVLFHSTEILWNLLERGNKHEVIAQLSTMESLVYASLKSGCWFTVIMTLLVFSYWSIFIAEL